MLEVTHLAEVSATGIANIIIAAAGVLTLGGGILMFFFGRRERSAVQDEVQNERIKHVSEDLQRHQNWSSEIAKTQTQISKDLAAVTALQKQTQEQLNTHLQNHLS